MCWRRTSPSRRWWLISANNAREVTRDQYESTEGPAPTLKLRGYPKQCVYSKDKALTPEELEEAIENELVSIGA